MNQSIDVAPCFASHPLKFSLVTTRNSQHVAYYDRLGQLTVASRRIDSNEWSKQWLPEKVAWDSHCGIEMAIDPQGDLHLCANMHGSRLRYYRSRPWGKLTESKMAGYQEDRCTYPQFITTESGSFVFMYRFGTCGDGFHIVNRLDHDGRWARLSTIFDGEGVRNAYPVYRDGHIVYTWREGTDCALNTLLCYAYTPDFVNWSRDCPPYTMADSEVVDPVPLHGGLLNGSTKIGWDSGILILSYHKYDEDGILQVYHARKRFPGWLIEQMTAFNEKRTFSGPGTINKPLTIDQFDRPKPGWRLKWDKRPANRDKPRDRHHTSMLRVIHD